MDKLIFGLIDRLTPSLPHIKKQNLERQSLTLTNIEEVKTLCNCYRSDHTEF